MNWINSLKDVLDYIDIGITNNNNKSHYILYISLIHKYFLNLEGIDFGLRYNILEQCNLIITKLVDSENDELKDDWVKIRNMIISGLIDNDDDEEINKDDLYFK